MAFDATDSCYQDLLARVVQTGAKVVPFVGAGLSAYGDPGQRLPMWRELLDRLVLEGQRVGLIPDAGDPDIDDALRSGRYIEATDRILDALGEPTFRRAVERELDDRSKPVPPGIAELVAVGWSLIVTTNLDRLIARAYFERFGRPITTVTSLDVRGLAAAFAGNLVTNETTLAQIHGAVDSYPSWRLTRTHYDQLLQDPGYVEALKHLFLRQVFFVGFGLQDDDFDFLLSTISRIYPAGVGEFYALVDRRCRHDPIVARLVRESGLRPVFYDVETPIDPADPYGGHRQVAECLAHLAETWAASTRELDVALQYFPELDPLVAGQDDEVARLTDLLTGDDGKAIQIIGLGGSGKTSLVQQVVGARRSTLAIRGYRRVIGCSFQRADVGQFIQDLVSLTGAASATRLADQVVAVCAELARHRTVLVLDGVEAVLDDRRRLRNPYMAKVIDAVFAGRGAVVVTSRVEVRGGVFEDGAQIVIRPLSPSEAGTLLAQWGLERLGETSQRHLLQVTQGHPLALRILAGVLCDVPATRAIEAIEQSVVIEVADEVDPLRENRLARILESYIDYLDDAELSLLMCATAFEGAVSYPALEAALTRLHPGTSVNAPLVGTDLRPVVTRLLGMRLVATNEQGELSSHPTVREMFARRARSQGESLVPIHRHLAAQQLDGAAELPTTFAEAAPLIAVCRHAAASGDWSLFDDVFRRRLQRGFRNFLCNNIGAWEEALDLARLAERPAAPFAATGDPAYYPVTVARCLKHLGRTAEARESYLDGLALAGEVRDGETARYVNNLLTLLVWRGELDAAEELVEINVRALSWVTEDWRRRWQTEHALSSIAYLRLLRGDPAGATRLFATARQAWDGHPEGRLETFDHYPLHRAEVVLLDDPSNHDGALADITPILDVARANRWPEAMCRGEVQVARVLIDAADHRRRPDDLRRAEEHLVAARSLTAGMGLPDVDIAHQLTQVHADLVHDDLAGGNGTRRPRAAMLLDLAASQIDLTELDLARPEVIAGRGAVALAEGDRSRAVRLLVDASDLCHAQANALAPASPRSLVGYLAGRLGAELQVTRSAPTAAAISVDPVELLGYELTVEQLAQSLRHVAAWDHDAGT